MNTAYINGTGLWEPLEGLFTSINTYTATGLKTYAVNMCVVVPRSPEQVRFSRQVDGLIQTIPSGFFNLKNCKHFEIKGTGVSLRGNSSTQLAAAGTTGSLLCDWFEAPKRWSSTSRQKFGWISSPGIDVNYVQSFENSNSPKDPRDVSIRTFSCGTKWLDAHTMVVSYQVRYEDKVPGTSGYSLTFSFGIQMSGDRKKKTISDVDYGIVDDATVYVNTYAAKAALRFPIENWGSSKNQFQLTWNQHSFPAMPSMERRIDELHLTYFPGSRVGTTVWKELSYQCIKQFDTFTGNGYAFAMDIAALRKAISAGRKILSLVQGEVKPKDVASLYLAWHYGLRLTIKDTSSLITSMRSKSWENRNKTQKRSSTHLSLLDGSLVTARYSIYAPVVDQSIHELYGLLHALDLDPTLENIWDLIPFSFVVDWFADMQGCLDRIDKMNYIHRTTIKCAGRTIKKIRSPRPGEFPGLQGTFVFNYYERTYSSHAINPRIALSLASQNPTTHWLEGAALIIQSRG